jgi:heme-degrading monooxygenase HmoA
MPTLPWIPVEAPGAGAEVTVMASRLEVRSLRHVPGFLLTSMSLLRQARRSDGAHGVALKAQLLRRTFWTLSAWRDEKAIRAYAAAEPHRSSMRAKRPVMRDSTFVFWQVKAGDLPITWQEARRRIDENRPA